jgi:hypothetical protein
MAVRCAFSFAVFYEGIFFVFLMYIFWCRQRETRQAECIK